MLEEKFLGSGFINIETKVYIGVGQPKREITVDIYLFFFHLATSEPAFYVCNFHGYN